MTAKNFENNFNGFFPQEEFFSQKQKTISNRFPPFVAKAISAKKSNEIVARCTKQQSINGEFNDVTDVEEYIIQLVCNCVVSPDLLDATLQAKYGVMTNSDLISTMLLPGEYSTLSQWILQICGFDKTGDQLVQEAKNV